jgi:hypothetical protein
VTRPPSTSAPSPNAAPQVALPLTKSARVGLGSAAAMKVPEDYREERMRQPEFREERPATKPQSKGGPTRIANTPRTIFRLELASCFLSVM